jgi:hypothetical protein
MGRPRNPELVLDPGELIPIPVVIVKEFLGEKSYLVMPFVDVYISM